jgi:capsular exopolysaccharide synthesis family protein
LIPVPAGELAPQSAFPWQASAAPLALAPTVTAGNLMHSLRRKWWIGAGLGVLFSIGFAIAAWYLVPAKQEVSAVLHVRRNDERLLDTMQRPVQKEEFEAFKMTQAGRVKHPMTIRAGLAKTDPDSGLELARNPEVLKHGDPVRWLEENLQVQFPGDAELMFVSLSGDDAKQLVKIVNAICDAYLKDVEASEKQLASAKLNEVKTRYTNAELQLTKAQQQYASYISTANVPDPKSAASAHMAKHVMLQALNTQILSMENSLFNINQKLAEVTTQLAIAQSLHVTDSQLEHELINDKLYQDKVKKRDELKEYIGQVAAKVVDPNSNKIKHVQALLQQLEQDIDEYREQMRPIIEENLRGPNKEHELTAIIKQHQEMKKSLEETLIAKREEQNTITKELNAITSGQPELERLAATIKLLQDDLATLSKAKLNLELMVQQEPRVGLMAKAEVPESASQTFRYMAVAFGAFFGFCLPIVGITFWDFQQHRVNRPHDASSALGLKILGALPEVAGRKGRHAIQAGGKSGLPASGLQRNLADSVDGVRTALLRDNAAQGTRVVLVTSAVHYEGKTTLASQLATSLARAGKRTLLVDADLRKPVSHRLFGLSLDPGLCEVLRAECELEETIRPTRASGLWMISAGRCDEEALHNLAKDGVDQIFTQLRAGFDFIIIDASPVLASADALVIGQYVDGAILSVLRDASRVPTVYEASDRLRGVGIRVLGTVFNGTKQEVKPVGASRRLPAKAASL